MQLELGLALRTPPLQTSPAPPPRRPPIDLRPAGTLPAARPPLLDLVEAFLLSAVDNIGTRRGYRAFLTRAFSIMRVEEPAAVTLARLAALRAVVVGELNLATATQAGFLSAVRGFFGWACLLEAFPQFTLDAVRRVLRLPHVTNIKIPEILDDGELPALFARARVHDGSRAMLAVFLGSGLRVAELCALELDDIHLAAAGTSRIVVRGKGRKDRIVPIHEPVVAAIAAYLRVSARELGRSAGRVFIAHDPGAPGRDHARISTRSVRRRITKLLREAGVTKRTGVHGLRHKFAFAMYEDGVDLKKIAKILGHVLITTTEKYIDHLASDRLRAAVPNHLVPSEPA